MISEPTAWRTRSPGDLSVEMPEASAGNVPRAVESSQRAFPDWRHWSFAERKTALSLCRDRLKGKQEDLARLVAQEIGKPLREARVELAAVIGKFDLTFSDAERFLANQNVMEGPYPALVRRRARGPAAVVAPFNFPIHLGHGAVVAYLLAGNTVLFKPSPLAANVGAAYASEMQAALPKGVFELVQGWGATGHALCMHPGVRSVCFTGSIAVGTALAQDLAADYSKSLALELGGKNALMVFPDADLDRAAEAAADGVCLTTGQRCNATSRILVHREVEELFIEKLLESLQRYVPGDPADEATMLGPLASGAALDRFRNRINRPGQWLLRGEIRLEVAGKRGYYVTPAIISSSEMSSLGEEEIFSPVATVEPFLDLDEAIARHEATPFGLTASVFTKSEETFHLAGEHLEVGNLYWNLPTTFSPSTLPFGGFRASGNGKPGARGFIRFAADEQALQWAG